MGFQIKNTTGKLLDPETHECKAKVCLEIAVMTSTRNNIKSKIRAMAEMDAFNEELWNKNYILELANKNGPVYLATPLFPGGNLRQTPLLFEGDDWLDFQWYDELAE
jgi:hypothetical protein